MRRWTLIQRSLLFVTLIYIHLFSMPPISLEETQNGYTFALDVPSIELKTIRVDDELSNGRRVQESFTRVSIPGFSRTGKFGEPELLIDKFNIALEQEAPRIQLSDVQTERIALSHKIHPAQIPEDLWRAANKKKTFCYSQDSYKRMQQEQSFVYVTDKSTYRGQNVATIVCNPIHYDPLTNELVVLKKVTVHLHMKKPTCVRSWNSKFFDTFIRNEFINLRSPFGNRIRSETLNEKEKYLIIVSDRYKDNADLKQFINYRNETGYDVEVVDRNSVGTTKDDFRTFIRNKKPTYCLLVGLDKEYPTHLRKTFAIMIELNIHSYNYFFFPDTSTRRPDIAHGLFFCNTEEGLKNLVYKTMTTEKNISTYPKVFVGFSGNDQEMPDVPANQTDICIDEWSEYFKTLNYETTMIYRVNQPIGGKKECIDAIKKGVRFLCYNGHGCMVTWSYDGQNDQMKYSDVQNLSNTIYPFTFAAACCTGQFKDTTCMGEYYTNHKALSVAYIGASELSSYGQHSLGRGLCRAIVEKNITKYGLAFLSAVNYVSDSSGGAITDMMKEVAAWQYHYFGDPAIETIENPTNIPISDKNVPEINNHSLTINVKSGIFHFTYKGAIHTDMTFSLYNLCGKTIVRKNFNRKNIVQSMKNQQMYTWKYTPSTKGLATGVYMVELKNGSRIFKRSVRFFN